MHRIFLGLVAAIVLAAAGSARASAPGSLDELMRALRVEEVATLASSQITGDEGFRKLPPEQQTCIARVFSAANLIAAIRPEYEALFATPEIRAQASTFLLSSVGRRLTDSMVAQVSSAGAAAVPPDFLATLTPAEMRELEAFAGSPAGKVFASFPSKSAETQLAAAQRLADQALRECGPPAKD